MAKIGKGLVKKQRENRDSSGFINPSKVVDIKALGGEWWRPAAESIHKINILPWQIKSKKDVAALMKGDFHKDVGDWVYSLNYWVHPRVNDSQDILCPKKSFGTTCPICEKAQEKWELYNEGGKTDEQKKAATALTPKLRSMYNIEVITEKLRGKNSFMEASDYIFEDELLEKATECEEGQEPVAFYEIDDVEGKIVKFTRPKEAMRPSKNFDFQDRKKAISKALLDGVVRFGEHVKIMTEEEISDFFYGANFIEKPEEEEEVEEEREREAYEEYEATEEELDAEEAMEEEDLEAEEAEEEPPKKAKKADGKWSECPSPKRFGVEFGDYDACDECPVEVACHKKHKALNE